MDGHAKRCMMSGAREAQLRPKGSITDHHKQESSPAALHGVLVYHPQWRGATSSPYGGGSVAMSGRVTEPLPPTRKDDMTSASSSFATLARTPRATDNNALENILICSCGDTADMRIPHEADDWTITRPVKCPKCSGAADIRDMEPG